ncbi:MAG: hypothetical protein GY847_09855 [Proteobacteria bacterium]|nr:hypothetical protein [Pseudomonadota bacterium]
MLRKTTLWMVLGGIMVLGAATYGVFSIGNDGIFPADSDRTGSATATIRRLLGGSGVGDRATTSWRVGEVREYRLSMKSKFGAEGQQTITDVAVSGTWIVRALGISDEKTDLAAELRVDSVDSKVGDGEDAENMENLRERFASPLFFSLTLDGHVQDVRLDPSAPMIVESYLKALAATFQFSDGAWNRLEWTTEEIDQAGSYQARYRNMDTDSYMREKLKYLEILGAQSFGKKLQTKIDLDSSLTEFTFKDGRITSLNHDERLSVVGPHMKLDSATKITLELSDVYNDKSNLASLMGQKQLLKSGTLYSRSNIDAYKELAKRRMAGLSDVTTALAKLSDMDKETNRKDRAQLFQATTSLLKIDSKAVQEAVELLRKKPDEAAFLISSLGFSGSPDAQTALIDLYDEELYDPNFQRMMLQSLSFSPNPTVSAMNKLQNLADHPLMGRAAKFGLGTQIENQKDPEAKKEALGFLTRGLEDAESDSQRINYIKALSNANQDESIKPITTHVKSGNHAVRAASVKAVRGMKTKEADIMIAHHILYDYDYRVRTEAARSALMREPTDVVGRALVEAIKQERRNDTKRHMYKLVSKWGPSAPHMNEAVAWIMANEKDDSLRSIIAMN